MKALWRSRPPTAFRRVGMTYVALAAALGSIVFLFLPHLAWVCPVVALVASVAAFVMALMASHGGDQPVDLVPLDSGIEVRIPGEATPALVLRGADLLGVSTCEGASGVDLAVTHRAQPYRSYVFEGVAPGDVEPLRRALALPHGGFGGAVFPQGTSRTLGSALSGVASFWFGIIFAFLCLGGAVDGATDLPALVAGTLLIAGAPFAFLVWLTQRLTQKAQRGQQRCMLRPEGFTLWERGAARTVPYGHIADVVVVRAGIELRLRDGTSVHTALRVLSVAERTHLMRQLLSARDRAVAKVSAASVEDSLRKFGRLAGEPMHAWLARVDSIAVLRGGEALYRATGIPEEELWRAVDDPDTPIDVRSAIARRLARVTPAARVRIDALRTRLHTAEDQGRFRVVVDADADALHDPHHDARARSATLKS